MQQMNSVEMCNQRFGIFANNNACRMFVRSSTDDAMSEEVKCVFETAAGEYWSIFFSSVTI